MYDTAHFVHGIGTSDTGVWYRTIIVIAVSTAKHGKPTMGVMRGALTPKVCWICKKPVPQKSMVDAFGFFAHEGCLESEPAISHSQTAIAAKQQA